MNINEKTKEQIKIEYENLLSEHLLLKNSITEQIQTILNLINDKDQSAFYETEAPKVEKSNKIIDNLKNYLEHLKFEFSLTISKYNPKYDYIPIYISSFLADGTITYINSAASLLFGYEQDELIGKNIFQIIDPSHLQKFKTRLANLSLDNPSETHELSYIDKDGIKKYQQWTNWAFFDENGKPYYYYRIGQDITEKKSAEALIKQNEIRLNSVVELSNLKDASLSDSYLFLSNKAIEISDSEIGYFGFVDDNEENVQIFAWSETVMNKCAVIDKSINFVVADTGLWGDVIRTRKPVIVNDYSNSPLKKGIPEGHVQIKNYASIPYIINNKIKAVIAVANKPSNYNENDITQLMLLVQDMWGIIERKQFLQNLQKAKEIAEENDNLKTAFLQNMSHEVRTPLNGIIGFAQILAEEELPAEERAEYANIIINSGKRLNELVNNILDISKIETRQIDIKPESVDLNKLLFELLCFYHPVCMDKNITLKYLNENDNSDYIIITDGAKLHQILTNLITNAIKFTTKGGIEFGYDIKEGIIEFFVKDTGIGISPDYHSKIFERFIQAGNNLARGYEGSGLGLTICKGLTELLEGKIWVESEYGKGACFYFTIPYNPVIMKKMIDNSDHNNELPKKNIKILVAEDDLFSYVLLEKLLKKHGYQAINASDGKEAVNICKTDPKINLVLMDIKLPVMNGIEASRQIKYFRPSLPIIAQTAYAYDEDREKIIEAGCDEIITKPIEQDVLFEKINSVLFQ